MNSVIHFVWGLCVFAAGLVPILICVAMPFSDEKIEPMMLLLGMAGSLAMGLFVLGWGVLHIASAFDLKVPAWIIRVTVGSYLLLVGAAAVFIGVRLLVSGLEDRPVVTAFIAIPIGLFMLWLFWRIITAKKRAPADAG